MPLTYENFTTNIDTKLATGLYISLVAVRNCCYLVAQWRLISMETNDS